jgi:xeroderma pigmentosum group C-complementing protein
MFFEALQDLVTWWSQSFFDISDATLGLRTRPWDEVQEIVDTLPKLTKADFLNTSFLNLSTSRDASGKGKSKEEEVEEKMETIAQNAGGERLRTVNSLMKKALKQEGSRDVSAILFVSLARACNLGVRLVTSLQPVPWRAEKQVAKKKATGAGRGGKSLASRQGNGDGTEEEDDEDDMEEVPIPLPEDEDGGPGNVKGKVQKTKIRQAGRRRHIDPADVYRLRAPKPAPKTAVPKKKPNKLSGWITCQSWLD